MPVKSTKKQTFLPLILKRSLVVLAIIILTTGWVSFMPVPGSGPYIDMQILIDNPKLKQAEAVLTPLLDGKSTTRIIVNLLPSRLGPRPGFNNDAVREQLVQDVKSFQDKVIEKLDANHVRITNRFTYIFGFSAEVTQQGLQALLNDANVLAVGNDTIRKAHTNQGIPLMNATGVRSTYNGADLSIAICDTGIDYTHPDLGGGGFPNTKVVGGRDTGQNDNNPMDANGHGTSCAGIAAGDIPGSSQGDYIGGVAHNARLYALKITFTTTGGSAYTSDIVEAWEWCVTNQNYGGNPPIMIISTSFGGGRYTSNCDTASPDDIDLAAAAASCKAVGITLFVSSGNDGFCNAIGSPACISDVVSVGAVFDVSFGTWGWCLDATTCAPWSGHSFCPPTAPPHEAVQTTAADLVTVYSNTASFLTLLAPSNQAYTTDITGSGGYDPGNYTPDFSGTSAACPYAAGAAACLQSAAMATHGHFLPPDTVEHFLVTTGDPITDTKVAITKPRINLGNAFGGITPVSVSDFKVTTDSGQSVVQWQTSSESGTIGFFLLRKGPKDKGYKRVNQTMLMGLLTSPQGGVYRMVDPQAVHGEVYQYKLVEIGSKGGRRTYGPYNVAAGQTGITASATGTMRYLKKQKPAHTLPSMRGSFGKKGHQLSAFKKARLKTMKRERKRLKLSRLKKFKGKAKITIRQDGLYLIRSADIANTLGLHPHQVSMMIRTNRLQLTNRGKNVSWLPAQGNSGIYFYGEKIESIFTNENIYWLKKGRGRLMRFVNGGHPVANSGLSFNDVSHIEKEQYALTALFDNPNDDYWLWDVIVSGQEAKKFNFGLHGVSASGDPSLIVSLKGATLTPHHVKVTLNGTQIGESGWQGTTSHQFTLSFDQSLLRNGENTIAVNGVLDGGTPYSIFYVDSFDLRYGRYYRALNNKLFCNGGDNRVITVDGFTNRNIMVFDVTHPRRPALVSGTTIDLLNRVSFVPASTESKYLVVGGAGVGLPASIVASGPAGLKKKNRSADYIVIVPKGFEQAAGDLVYLRQRSGFDPVVVELEDIYDQFNHGIASPFAIKKFLTHAYNNWRGGDQKYVVLAGEGTYDYKDHLGYGENLIPPIMVSTPHGLFAADNQYGDVSGNDGVPEFVVGRLPVATEGELRSYIQKLTAYENSSGDWTGRVIMVADNKDGGGNFPYDCDRLSQLVSDYSVEKVYLPHFSDIDQAREKLFATINQGAAFINYVGHAGLNKLAEEGWLEIDDLSYLQNNNMLPVMTAWTCVSGRFSLPGFDTLSEALVLKENGGVIATLAPTGFSENFQANALAQQLFKIIFTDNNKVFGSAVLQAVRNFRQNGGPAYLANIYNILGDPGLNLK